MPLLLVVEWPELLILVEEAVEAEQVQPPEQVEREDQAL
jgi:hypothetical protein